jgi:uncharacterized membrane protein YccC
VRSMLGVLAISLVALVLGYGAAAMWAAAAGAIASAVSLQDMPGRRLPVVVVASMEMGAAVLLGGLATHYDVVFVAVVALWCFAAGMQWALGSNAGFLAAAASALLVAAPPTGPAVVEVVVATALTMGAGLLQAGIVSAWPPRRWRVQRDALSRAYRQLAAEARSLAAEDDIELDPRRLVWLREVFGEIPQRQRPKAYYGGYRLPERVASNLSALQTKSNQVAPLLEATADLLEAVPNHGVSARRDADRALQRVDAAAESLTDPIGARATRLANQLHEIAALRFGQVRGPELGGWLRGVWARLRRHLTWTSPVLRHALRLAVATALGAALARFADSGYGVWVPLTVLLTLRPETAHTYTRCAARLAGVVAGFAVAAALSWIWQPTGAAALIYTAVFFGLTYTASVFGYVAVSAALAAAAVFVTDIAALSIGRSATDLVLAALIGGALAMTAHVLLPDDALVRLRQRAGELLMTEVDYAATIIRGFVHPLDRPADAVSAAWQRAFRARAAFEAASGTTRLESRELRGWLRSYRTALNAVTSSCITLEDILPPRPATALSDEFTAAIDDYVDALRGAPPNPAAPWTVDIAELAAAERYVREVANELNASDGASRVLAAELAAITRSLSGIGSSREPSGAG